MGINEGFIIAVGLGVLGGLLFQPIWALVWGIRAIRHSRYLAPPQRMAMRFIGVHMAEPIINIAAVGVLVLVINENLDQILAAGGVFGSRSDVNANLARELLISTWPMLILLLPIFGVLSADETVGRINTRLVILGIARWATTALILVFPLALPVGILLLWYCIAWSRRQINHLAAYSHQAIGFDGQGVLVDYAENMQPGAARINR